MRIETKLCIKCGEIKDIPQRHKHSTNICKDCQNEASRRYQKEEAIREGRRVGLMGRLPYPLEGKWSYPSQKFNSIRKNLDKFIKREDWIKQMKSNLEETFNNKEVMDWINAHKDEAPLKRQKKIERDYPDTTKMTWDEWEKGGWGDEVDS